VFILYFYNLLLRENFMCGIVSYIGPKDPVLRLLKGLRRLEYRGYDSAGVALIILYLVS
tara:strand:- start:3110 stop:3286 length:177 start_codon:yes stop_codon:yes gene_type:complete